MQLCAKWLEGRRARAFFHELPILLRASASSLTASAVDGIAYQAILFAALGSYTVAGFVGALVGGITNFVVNRIWAFPPTTRDVKAQMFMYALASGIVYGAFQACLVLFVEVLHVNEHWAWFPAQIIAWVGVSYPLFRWVVFAHPRKRTCS